MSESGVPVLVVDDMETVRGLVMAFLHELGYESHGVENVASAQEWLAKNVPPLVILDVMMPDGNGLDLCRWIRSQPRISAVPVIVMTAIEDDETAQDAFQLGAMDFIRKPIEMGVLAGKLERFLGPRRC